MADVKRIRGLFAMLTDAVEGGSSMVEKVQKAAFERPMVILEAIPGVAEPAKAVHTVHDICVSGVHGMIRGVNRVVGAVVDAGLENYDQRKPGAS